MLLERETQWPLSQIQLKYHSCPPAVAVHDTVHDSTSKPPEDLHWLDVDLYLRASAVETYKWLDGDCGSVCVCGWGGVYQVLSGCCCRTCFVYIIFTTILLAVPWVWRPPTGGFIKVFSQQKISQNSHYHIFHDALTTTTTALQCYEGLIHQ